VVVEVGEQVSVTAVEARAEVEAQGAPAVEPVGQVVEVAVEA